MFWGKAEEINRLKSKVKAMEKTAEITDRYRRSSCNDVVDLKVENKSLGEENKELRRELVQSQNKFTYLSVELGKLGIKSTGFKRDIKVVLQRKEAYEV